MSGYVWSCFVNTKWRINSENNRTPCGASLHLSRIKSGVFQLSISRY